MAISRLTARPRRGSALLTLLAAIALGFAAAWRPAAGEEEPRFFFDTGDPPWAGERIVLPPGFAPDLGWSGVEDIRFAPGMFDPEAPGFFSYVLVFALAPEDDVSPEALQRELLTYYRGLARSVMGSRGLEVDAAAFEIQLEEMESEAAAALAPAAAAAGEGKAWAGTLDWVEPFATREPQTLHLEVHAWTQAGRPVVLSCVSPLDPGAEGLWDELRAIRAKFRLQP